MVKFLNIAGKNLKTLFRDKKGLLFMILIPIMFYSIMGLVFGGQDTTSDTYVYQIGWVDNDSSSSGSPYKNLEYIADIIDNLEGFDVNDYDLNESAYNALKNKDIDAYLIFPEGYELYLNGSAPHPTTNVTVFYRDSASDVTRNIVSATIFSIIDGVVNYDPGAIVIQYEENTISGKDTNQLTSGTPGYLMYGILSSLTGGIILITQEHKDGMLKRLESSQMKASDMIIGHLLSNTVIVIVQFAIGITTLSVFGFSPFFSDIFSLIFGVLMTVVLLSIFQNALAMIAGAILKSPEAAGGGIWVLLIPLMTFSGAFFPLELVAPSIIPYVGWIPTRIVVILVQDIMVNAVPVWSSTILLKFLWLFLEGLGLFFIGTLLYRQFARS